MLRLNIPLCEDESSDDETLASAFGYEGDEENSEDDEC